jgi:hypothetical protein
MFKLFVMSDHLSQFLSKEDKTFIIYGLFYNNSFNNLEFDFWKHSFLFYILLLGVL